MGALEDAKSAISWLERRAPNQWGKPIAPPIVVETHPIKQIVIHSNRSDVKKLTEHDKLEVIDNLKEVLAL